MAESSAAARTTWPFVADGVDIPAGGLWRSILDQMADAVAFATATFGFAKVPVTQVTARPGKGKSRAGSFDRDGEHLVR